MRTRHDKVRDIIIRDLQGSFSFPIFNRITVIADLEHYSKDDPWVFDQHRGNKPDYYEIYWDAVWITDFTTAQNPKIVYLNFWHGLLQAYMAGKIEMNEWLPEFEKVGGKLDESLIRDGLMAKNEHGNYEKTGKFKMIEDAHKEAEAEIAQEQERREEKVINKLKKSSSEVERTAGEVIAQTVATKKARRKKGTQ